MGKGGLALVNFGNHELPTVDGCNCDMKRAVSKQKMHSTDLRSGRWDDSFMEDI